MLSLLLLMSHSAVPWVSMDFHAEISEEIMNGRPKQVRVERQELPAKDDSAELDTPHIVEETDFRADGKATERRSYGPDGSSAGRVSYTYNADGKLSTVTRFDPLGAQSSIKTVRRQKPNIEEITDIIPDSDFRGSTSIRLNEGGRPIESILRDASQETARLSIDYDAQGRPVAGGLLIGGGNEGAGGVVETVLHISISYRHDGGETITISSPDGVPQFGLEVVSTDQGRTLSYIAFDKGISRSLRTEVERIDSKDPVGNWTRKTILEREGENQQETPTAILYRDITYY